MELRSRMRLQCVVSDEIRVEDLSVALFESNLMYAWALEHSEGHTYATKWFRCWYPSERRFLRVSDYRVCDEPAGF